ncbi:hypothetical protein PRUPE_2G218900 [Prunus persica]|uniref:Uncharacterized protein n=1 Tax=Prunus persica TaxID=3760 RepID=A0A251QJP1_PRUPE|nr:hypothetical protein PRUPE_2G218900 [Prunus persica]
MNVGLSKLGTALTVVFAAILAALVAQLFFLLWRRRNSVDVDVDEVFKWQQALYDVSLSVLFTIEEEEERRAEKEVKTATTVLLDVAVMVMSVEVDDRTTPFSTPCASLPYYTPSPSPDRETCSV